MQYSSKREKITLCLGVTFPWN